MSTQTFLGRIVFDRRKLTAPPVEMMQYLASSLEPAGDSSDPASERRRAHRYGMATVVPAVAIDEQFQPIGEPFMLLTRNISTSGIALVHTSPIDAERLAIEMTGARGEKIQVALEILRSEPLGDYYEIGGRYLCKLGQ